MSMKDTLAAKLTAAFAPVRLEVVDDSHRHAGHAGARPGGETHFNVEMVSAAFAGKSRVERHRMVHAVLAEELRDSVHALALKLEAPDGMSGSI
ncbi:MAG: BolA family protein [Thalassobaculum sp.]|uniref:BolA family protein n=1 Tax=Thalassobaculum sp. TaxID=2022740 RepID=UPI0032EB15E8